MKLIDLIGTASSNMLRSKVRTILTIVAIFIGALTITLTVGISSGISSYIDKQLGNIGSDDVLLIQPMVDISLSTGPQPYDPEKTSESAQGPLTGMATLSSADIEKIKNQSGISSVQPIIALAPDYIEGSNEDRYQISVQSYLDGGTYDLAAGSYPNNTASNPEVMIPVSYIDVLGYSSSEDAIGKTVSIAISSPLGQQETVTASISGVMQQSLIAQGGAQTNTTLTNALHAVQTEGLPESFSDRYFAASAKVKDGATEQELTDIKKDLATLGYDAQTVADQIGIIMQVINAITYVLIFFGAIALFAASFGIINTLFMSVQERTKEIGLMKAMGMSRAKVFLLFSIEAVLLGFWGSVIGIASAFGIGQVANALASQSFLKDLPGFTLTVFPIGPVLIIMLVIMLIAFLAGTLPARRASKLDPIDALRYE